MTYRENFNPICFLAPLGSGGLLVSFYMYLMFLVPHDGVPMATFEFIFAQLIKTSWLSSIIILALISIVVFAFFHFKLLIFNTKQFLMYKKTKNYQELKNSNAEITLITIPLSYAMSINVCFVLAAVFIPKLWTIVEYLFPFALLGFFLAGYFTLQILFAYLSRILVNGDFEFSKNNSLSQMISIFALSMIAVGFAAPAAMSKNLTINAIGTFGALFFASLAIILLILKLTIGFKDMLKQGVSLEASPSLWISIPILTLLGITMIRILFGLEHNFNANINKSTFFILTSIILALQIFFLILGYKVMKINKYFETFVEDEKTRSSISFALICPGVALMVFGMFFINFGLTYNNIVEKYSFFYFLLMIPFVFIQIKTVQYFFILKNKFAF